MKRRVSFFWVRFLCFGLLSFSVLPARGADVQDKSLKSPFKGLESKVAALAREFPRALAFRPPEEGPQGDFVRFVKAAEPLCERFQLPREGLYEALRDYGKKRLSKIDVRDLETARFYFILGRYPEAVEIALSAGDEAHRSKKRLSAEVVAALELAAYGSMEQRKYVDARKYLTVAATETNPKDDLSLWTQIQTAMAHTSYLLTDYPAQQKILREVMDRHRLALGPGHIETLRYHNELAAALYDQRQDVAAEKEYRAILQRLEENEEADSPALTSVRKNLAAVLESLGRLVEEESLRREVLASQQRTLGKTHPQVLSSRFRLANCLRGQKKFEEAEAELNSMLVFTQRFFGQDSSEVIRSRSNLASYFYELGRYAEAATQFQVLYEQEKKIFGPDHSETLTSYNDLGVCMNELGQHEKAEAILSHVLQCRLKKLPPDDLDTLGTRNNLGIAYEGQKKLLLAEEQYRASYTARARLLGPDHPKTLAVRNNLTGLLKDDHTLEQVLQEYRSMLVTLEKQQGPDHPQTMVAHTNIANYLIRLKRFSEAEKELRWIYETRLKTLGTRHPLTLESQIAWNWNFYEQQRYAQAEEKMRQSIPLFREVLQPEELLLQQFYCQYSLCLAMTGRMDEAIRLLSKTQETLAKHHGNHPLTEGAATNLALLKKAQATPNLQPGGGQIIQGISPAAVMQAKFQNTTELPLSLPWSLPTQVSPPASLSPSASASPAAAQ